ncbi:phytanoyl-CoA dioxygenase family protein [Paenibacillus arenilitoris]|uniref:Phytanoyl-CoA dioxygenase family protein n=1 Tax=Paenibacillus arenilitoris TaxID=2772299 RepID=A0A927CNC2_9BACL|nr:phytanoyl-CoA dioxygenase family protein [Paenibacillus arenilitoris]MBD2868991.1 phytanoyl-CoA dioxygenase family protein [Paenibacillus arenilitoris]
MNTVNVLNARQLQATEQQIRYYRENGFVQLDDVITPEELAELREYLDETMGAAGSNAVQTDKAGGAYYKVLNQRVNTWRDHGGMGKFSLSERFAGLARQLTGASGMRLFHDHALYKMPQDSKPTPWHQDFPYWPMKDSGALSLWLTLDDVDENNGCMMFIPKSQKLKNLKSVDFLEPHDLFDETKGQTDRNTAVVVRMKAGSCTFHDGLTFHYAHANQTDRPRRVLAIIFMPDGTIYNGKPHVVSDGQNLAAGEPFRGPMFPLLA